MGESSAITFEILYDLVRKEKSEESIQKLPPDISNQMVHYLTTKLGIYRDAKPQGLAEKELENIRNQIQSARKLVKELYERRERKIIQLALNMARADVTSEDANLLDFERNLQQRLTVILNEAREKILHNLVNAKAAEQLSE